MQLFILSVLSLLFISCASKEGYDHNYDNIIKNFDSEKHVHVKIRSKFNKDFPYSSKKIYVFPSNGKITTDNPWFRYFSDYVYAAFHKEGYVRAKIPEKAEIGILLDYHIGHPIKYTQSMTKPSHDGTKTVKYLSKKKNVYDLPIIRDENGTRRVYNYHTQTVTTFLYKRKVTLVGIDLIKYKQSDGLIEDNEIFKMKFESVGSSNDLKKIFPILMAAGRRYIGKTLDGPAWRKMNFYSRELRSLVAFIQADNNFKKVRGMEDDVAELYYMLPPTSRPRRLRVYEEPVYNSF